jgi:Fe-Mn family superoxide dismutase
MLSIAARSIKSSAIKTSLRPLTAARSKVTLPELPYDYDVSERYH